MNTIIVPIFLLALNEAQTRTVEEGCPELSATENVDSMERNGDSYAYEFYKGDIVDIVCYEDYIIPWKKTLTKKGKLECKDVGGKVKWAAVDSEVAWTYSTGVKVCKDCVKDHVECNGGTCDGNNDCKCETGKVADLNFPRECHTNVCPTNFCQNDGYCEADYLGVRCDCRDGTSGDKCEKITVCDSKPCKNNGVCKRDDIKPKVYNKYTCECPADTTGDDCGLTCPGDSGCQNGGRCKVDKVNEKLNCECPANFKGDKCGEEITCPSDHCKNGGDCTVEGPDKFSCKCAKGFSGQTCEVAAQIDDKDCDPKTDVNCDHGKNSTAAKTLGNIVIAFVFLTMAFN
jgi:hypothetical protein